MILGTQAGPQNRSKIEPGAKVVPRWGPGGPQDGPESDFGSNLGSSGVPLGLILDQFGVKISLLRLIFRAASSTDGRGEAGEEQRAQHSREQGRAESREQNRETESRAESRAESIAKSRVGSSSRAEQSREQRA